MVRCPKPSMAFLAWVTSIFIFASPYVLKRINPSTNVEPPDEIQLECTYKKEAKDHKKEEAEKICEEQSNIKLIADLFSIWNKSTITSTKPEILQKIYAVICLGDDCSGSSIFKWKYFTEILDDVERRVNAGRILVNHNSIRNIEVEFYQQGIINNSNKNEILYDGKSCKSSFDTTIDDEHYWNWEKVKKEILPSDNDYISIRFCLDLEYSKDRYFKCKATINEFHQSRFEDDKYNYDYFLLDEPIIDKTDKSEDEGIDKPICDDLTGKGQAIQPGIVGNEVDNILSAMREEMRELRSDVKALGEKVDRLVESLLPARQS